MADTFQTASLTSQSSQGSEIPQRFQRRELTMMGATPAPAQSPTPAAPQAPTESKAAQFAAIAKEQERVLRAKQAHKAAQNQLAAERAALAQERAEIEALKAKRGNPQQWLEAGGHTYQDLTQTVLNQGELTAEQIAKQTQAELRAFQERQEQERSERQEQENKLKAQEEAQILSSFQTEIGNFVETHASEFELTSKMNQASLVFQTIDEYFNQTGQVLPIRQAAELTEKYLEAEVQKVTSIPKVRGFFAPEPPAKLDLNSWRPREAAPRTQIPQPVAPRPLTRTLTNSAAPTAAPARGYMNEDERIYRARLRLRGQTPT